MTLSLLGRSLVIELYGRTQSADILDVYPYLRTEARYLHNVPMSDRILSQSRRNAPFFLLACSTTTESTELG